MKTVLSIEQSAKLINLGVDPKLASEHHVGRWEHYSNGSYPDPESVSPLFTLTDILSILPKEIEYNDLTYGFNMWVENGVWFVEYCAENGVYDYLVGSSLESSELIDALYQLLIWAIERGYLNLNQKEQ